MSSPNLISTVPTPSSPALSPTRRTPLISTLSRLAQSTSGSTLSQSMASSFSSPLHLDPSSSSSTSSSTSPTPSTPSSFFNGRNNRAARAISSAVSWVATSVTASTPFSILDSPNRPQHHQLSSDILASPLGAILYPTLQTLDEGPILVLSLSRVRALPLSGKQGEKDSSGLRVDVGESGEEVEDSTRGPTDDQIAQAVLDRLEPWVGEDGGKYTILLLAGSGGGLGVKDREDGGKGARRRLPSVAWWIWKYRRLPRKYRKNLKNLFVVHSSPLTRTLLPLLLPLLSPKFYRKLHVSPTLVGLRGQIPLSGIELDIPTLIEEGRALRQLQQRPARERERGGKIGGSSIQVSHRGEKSSVDEGGGAREESGTGGAAGIVSGGLSWGYSTVSGAMGAATSYLGLTSQDDVVIGRSGESESERPMPLEEDLETGFEIKSFAPCGTNEVLFDLTRVILRRCTEVEGIFRRSSNLHLLLAIQSILAVPEPLKIPWDDVASYDPMVPTAVLKKVIGGTKEPVIGFDMYGTIKHIQTVNELKSFRASLPSEKRAIISHLTHLAHHLLPFEHKTKMTSRAYAIVFAPTLLRSNNPMEDAMMCLEPERGGRPGLGGLFGDQPGSQSASQTLVGVLDIWINNWVNIESNITSASEIIDRDGSLSQCDCPWSKAEVRSTKMKQSSTGTSLGLNLTTALEMEGPKGDYESPGMGSGMGLIGGTVRHDLLKSPDRKGKSGRKTALPVSSIFTEPA